MPPYCPQCGIDNPGTARYCDQCGAALVQLPVSPSAPTMPTPTAAPPPIAVGVVCPQCGASAIPGEAFCDNCGAPLSAPASAPTMPAPAPPYSTGVPAQPVYPPPQPAAPPSYSGVAPQPAAPQPPAPPPIFYPEPEPFGAPPPLQPPTLPPRHLPTLPDQPAPLSTQPMPSIPPPVASRTVLAPARLVVAATGAALPLSSGAQMIVGRADAVSKFYPDLDLTPYGALDNGVGRRHLRLFVQGGQIMAEDQDSTNGTIINGQKLQPRQPQPLRDGDTVQLGKLILRFHL
jgi:FHA domain/Double zinc ribbon